MSASTFSRFTTFSRLIAFSRPNGAFHQDMRPSVTPAHPVHLDNTQASTGDDGSMPFLGQVQEATGYRTTAQQYKECFEAKSELALATLTASQVTGKLLLDCLAHAAAERIKSLEAGASNSGPPKQIASIWSAAAAAVCTSCLPTSTTRFHATLVCYFTVMVQYIGWKRVPVSSCADSLYSK